jgi:hypothetical protein
MELFVGEDAVEEGVADDRAAAQVCKCMQRISEKEGQRTRDE